MYLNRLLVLSLFVIIGIIISLVYPLIFLIAYILTLVVMETASYLLIKTSRKYFQWLITPDDEHPELSKEGLKKFIKHGYDPELGWIRKPNTGKGEIGKFEITRYNIDKKGSRKNPGHERLPKRISFYGDSFFFGRQVNDNETCQWHLSELTKSDILNFSVGNYGLDQALLRLKREYKKNKTKIVIIGVVPSTIVRILSVWKHYNEFGNTFGFKPRFVLENGNLKLIRNFIDNKDKFLEYREYLPEIKKYDYFYETKFRKEMIRFPYLVSILSNPARNFSLIFLVLWHKWFKKESKLQTYPAPMKVIMHINLLLRYSLYKKNKYAVNLMEKLVEDFAVYAKKNKFTPIFLFMPQKDDLLFIKKKGCYYGPFLRNIRKKLHTIDLTPYLIDRKDLDEIYSEDNVYGGHYSSYGNMIIAQRIYKDMKESRIL